MGRHSAPQTLAEWEVGLRAAPIYEPTPDVHEELTERHNTVTGTFGMPKVGDARLVVLDMAAEVLLDVDDTLDEWRHANQRMRFQYPPKRRRR
jgi:hypothetical protein